MHTSPPTYAQTLRLTLALLAACLTFSAIAATSASASVTGYNEPAFTKTSGNNTFWWQWQRVAGFDSNGNTNNTYYHCLSTYKNNASIESHQGWNGPSSLNCTGNVSGTGGDAAYQPMTSSYVVDDGARYSMCMNGYYLYYAIWSQDNANIGNCPSTIIDRNAPAITASVNGTAQYTNNPNLALRIDYSDATSYPWYGSDGRASNWTCISRNAACTPGGNPDPNCSNPAAWNRNTYFTCAADATNAPDGDYHFCAKSADAAVPDNPSGKNQFAYATSNYANISGVACGHVVLDRVGPVVSVSSSHTTATVGQLVSFSGSASDPAGISGQLDWDFGDNTQPGSGAATTHTYTQAGTYQVKLAARDGAGNTALGTKTITVTAASGGSGSGSGTGSTGGSGSTGGGSGAGVSEGTVGVTPVAGPISPTVISQSAGGGGAQKTVIGGLGVIAPKSLKANGRNTLVLALTPETAGKAQVAVLRGARIVARKGATFGGGGTYSLKVKLPKKLKPGTHVLKVSFTPAGADKTTTKTLKLKVAVARKARRASKAAAAVSLAGKGAARTKPAGRPAPATKQRIVLR